MVVFVVGGWKPQLPSAENTRSWDSLTAESGRPTKIYLSSPRSPLLTSTVTLCATTPRSAPDCVIASILTIFKNVIYLRGRVDYFFLKIGLSLDFEIGNYRWNWLR